MSGEKPNRVTRTYGAGVRTVNKLSLVVWLLLLIMLASWLSN